MIVKHVHTLPSEERKYAHTLLSLSRTPIFIGGFIWIAMMLMPMLNEDLDKNFIIGYVLYYLTMTVGSTFMVLLIWWPFRFIAQDVKGDEKIIEETTIKNLQKVGFFEMNADSALGIMAGAIYYLWVPDETRSPPHRRFRIGLTTYRQLMLYGNGPIDIAYLPKSGMILSIDTTDYRYAAWEPSDKRHQYKSEHV